MINTPLDITFSFTGICLTYWLHRLRTMRVFLGGAPAFICHCFCPFVCRTPYLRSCTSCNHNFWYTWVEWWHLQAFFIFLLFYFYFYFYFFIFFRSLREGGGLKEQKIIQNKKKYCPSRSVYQVPYIILLIFMVLLCKMNNIAWYFFIFSKFWFSGLLEGKKAKGSVRRAPYLRIHTSYGCH